MSNVWYVIAIVGIAAAVILFLRTRKSVGSRPSSQPRSVSGVSPNYDQDREEGRLAHMSAEDRAWETASLQRNQARNDALADQRV